MMETENDVDTRAMKPGDKAEGPAEETGEGTAGEDKPAQAGRDIREGVILRGKSQWEQLWQACRRHLEESGENPEELVARCAELFRPFNLEKASLANLEAYFRYLALDTRPEEPIPFTYKLHVDFEAKFIIRTFLRALELLTDETQGHVWISEKELMEASQETIRQLGDAPVAVFGDCLESPMTESEASVWEDVADLLESMPGAIAFLCAKGEVLDRRFKGSRHLFYRVFRHNIILHDDARIGSEEKPVSSTVETILDRLYEILSGRGFTVTAGFREDIQVYVNAIYPTAELKEDRFVRDLVTRVAMNYYRERRDRHQLDESCVPYFKKRRTGAE